MEQNKGRPPPRTLWAYGYEIAPPLPQDRLRAIEALLDDEHSNAKLGARRWKGRFVVAEQVTHILVVSDGPDQDLEVNRRLEAELEKLEVGFSRTAPLAVVERGEREPSSDPPPQSRRSGR